METAEALLALDPDKLQDVASLRAALRAAQAQLVSSGKGGSASQPHLETASLAAEEVGAACSEASPAGCAPCRLLSYEKAKAMLVRERELRLAPETQRMYAEAELRQDTDWMECTDALQRQVLREFGVSVADEACGLRELRAAPYRWPDLKQIAIYHKFQRSRQGSYGEGDRLPPGLVLVDLHGRPASLNALCSGPGLVGAFHSLLTEFRHEAEFVAVYITEAHAQDEWPISSARYAPDGRPVTLNQPRTTEERVATARRFVEAFSFQVPMLVDPIKNPFDAVFAPWPIRFYILQQGRIAFKAQPRNCSYDLSDLRSKLLELLGRDDKPQ